MRECWFEAQLRSNSGKLLRNHYNVLPRLQIHFPLQMMPMVVFNLGPPSEGFKLQAAGCLDEILCMTMQERALAAAQNDSSLQNDEASRKLQSDNARLQSELQNLENELQSVERQRDRSSAATARLADEVKAKNIRRQYPQRLIAWFQGSNPLVPSRCT